jgi:hypothetical protein
MILDNILDASSSITNLSGLVNGLRVAGKYYLKKFNDELEDFEHHIKKNDFSGILYRFYALLPPNTAD